MKLHIYCAMCGKEKTAEIDKKAVTELTTLGELIRGDGWNTQQNGKNFDIYCSRTCAA